jgi:hypothetical protein
MSGSYYTDKQIVSEFSAITLGGHKPDEDSMEAIKGMNEDHKKEMIEMLESWAMALRGE